MDQHVCAGLNSDCELIWLAGGARVSGCGAEEVMVEVRPPSPAQRRAPAVPPVPLDPSSSDDGYGDSDFDDFDDE